MGKSYNSLHVGLRGSLGITTRSGRKAFNPERHLFKRIELLSQKTTPIKKAKKSSRRSKAIKSSRRSRVKKNTCAKKYKRGLRERILERKNEFQLKRVSSRLAAKHFVNQQTIENREKLFNKFYRIKRYKLQKMLYKNRQPTNGSKKTLARRVAEGIMYGVIPQCRKCQHGSLNFNFFKGIYSCSGYLTSEMDWNYCNKKYDFSQVDLGIWKN